MSFYTLMILAVALGTDAFSLCVGIGIAGITRRQIAYISVTVLIFHILMPLTGWYVGEFAGSRIGRAAAVIGALLLFYLGVRMIWTSWQSCRKYELKVIKFNTWGLILLGVSVSIDALSVGFTLGARQVDLLLTVGTIGIVAGIMTACGLVFGRMLGTWVGERAQMVGGVILVGIGTRLLF